VSRKPTPTASKSLAFSACVVAVAGVAAIWAGASVLLKTSAPWFAIVAALDAALLLHLANWPRGRSRIALALGVTLATIVVAQYFVATAQIGVLMGLRPVESLPLMSIELAWLYAQHNHGPVEWLCYAASMAVAWALSR
jgi:Mn2+/Fe2+ NRAMP family transporter